MNMRIFNPEAFDKKIQEVESFAIQGRVCQIIGTVIEGYLPGARMGNICDVISKETNSKLMSEVVGFRGDKVLLAPYESLVGVSTNSSIRIRGEGALIKVGDSLLGRIVDGMGNILDGKGEPEKLENFPLYNDPPSPVDRKQIKNSIDLGIRAINGLFTCGKGQRVALMAGSGVGKSVLLGMVARNVKADINVIGLIGERGREVREFIEKDLGPEGLAKSVLVVVSSEKSPLLRIRGANLATAIAEYFRDRGKNVLLMMDSITRFAHAQREIGLAIGEPPTSKGYTPSVFSSIPKLLERVGTCKGKGAITGIYTVLVDQDDLTDPVADTVRGTLDGHIVLSRELAQQGVYPAIDIEASLSRLMIDVIDKEHWNLSMKAKHFYSVYERSKMMIEIGAYQRGSDQDIDESISKRSGLLSFLRQDINEKCSIEESVKQIGDLINNNQETQ